MNRRLFVSISPFHARHVREETRTGEIFCKPTEEQNQRLTIGLFAVYHQGEKRALFMSAEQWNDACFYLQILLMQDMSGNLLLIAAFVPPSV